MDVPALAARIRRCVPQLDVYDKPTYSRLCMEYWLTRTGMGISFGLATLLGLCVGLSMVAQALYATVTERVKEFATLKALGATEGCIARFLAAQVLGSAGLGSALGLLGAWLLGRTLSTPRAPLVLTGWAMAGSTVLITLVCLLAAWLPYGKIRRIDPASVLRG